jgi:hypothetical protein
MSRKRRTWLPPQEATSFEELQARCAAARTQSLAIDWPWSVPWQVLLVGVFGSGAGFAWWRIIVHHGMHAWGGLILACALFCSSMFLRFLLLVTAWALCMAMRHWRLNQLLKKWRAKAELGEIPWTSSGAPKVWQDEIEPGDSSA